MTIWTCKGGAAALALTLLAGCEGGVDASFLDGFNLEGLNLAGAGPDVALSQARMAFGALDLVPPPGYCIDKRTLKQSFAVMARCDKLGVPSAAGDAPLGIITASFALAPDTRLPTAPETAAALNLTNVSDAISSEKSVVFRAETPSPLANAGRVHWRGTARMGSHLVGLALYGPDDGRAVSDEGLDVLLDVITASGPAKGQ